MPRLLLVDENPSIRRSAEILLGGTDVELVALASADEALAEVAAGSRFDVALIHAYLPGATDGWGLLAQLRNHPATAHLPIALMAGVLREVDPVQIAEAPIQGFLRKPIELGNLRERLTTIMATPVLEPLPPKPPAFETVPGAPLDLLLPLPETRAEEAPVEHDDDLLILEVEDLFPGDAVPVPLHEDMASEDLELEVSSGGDSLELEELDLEALQILESTPPPPSEPVDFSWSEPTPFETPSIPEVPPTWDELPVFTPEVAEAAPAFLAEVKASEGTVDLPDLGADLSSDLELDAEAPSLAPAMAFTTAAILPTAAVLEPFVEPPPELAPAILAEPPIEPPPLPSPTPASSEAQALVRALIADPEALDSLCRAVVGQLGERALREIAWDIMPDLAKKLLKP